MYHIFLVTNIFFFFFLKDFLKFNFMKFTGHYIFFKTLRFTLSCVEVSVCKDSFDIYLEVVLNGFYFVGMDKARGMMADQTLGASNGTRSCALFELKYYIIKFNIT